MDSEKYFKVEATDKPHRVKQTTKAPWPMSDFK